MLIRWTFIAFTNFAKSINLLWMVSLWCMLLFKRSTNWRVINKSHYHDYGEQKFELKCLLIIFTFTSIQNSRSLAKIRTLNSGALKLTSKGKKSKTCNITVAILLFAHRNTSAKLSSCVLCSLLFVIKQSSALENGSI